MDGWECFLCLFFPPFENLLRGKINSNGIEWKECVNIKTEPYPLAIKPQDITNFCTEGNFQGWTKFHLFFSLLHACKELTIYTNSCMREVQPSSYNYRKLVGAASDLKDVYYNYQKQIQSKEGKLETCHSAETKILREKHTSCSTKLCFLEIMSTYILFQWNQLIFVHQLKCNKLKVWRWESHLNFEYP